MNEMQAEAKALFDRLFALQKSREKPDADGWTYVGGNAFPVPAERALELAKQWIAKMEADDAKNDMVLAEFDMICAIYWLRFVIGSYSIEVP